MTPATIPLDPAMTRAQAANFVASYIEIERCRRMVAAATGFAQGPTLNSGGREVHPNEAGFAQGEIFAVVRAGMLEALKQGLIPIEAIITGPQYRIPKCDLNAMVAEALGEDLTGAEASEAEKVIFDETSRGGAEPSAQGTSGDVTARHHTKAGRRAEEK